jgi:hypothetical protein
LGLPREWCRAADYTKKMPFDREPKRARGLSKFGLEKTGAFVGIVKVNA